jgi:hypothetical protein
MKKYQKRKREKRKKRRREEKEKRKSVKKGKKEEKQGVYVYSTRFFKNCKKTSRSKTWSGLARKGTGGR